MKILVTLAVLLAGWAAMGARPNILLAIADDWSFPHASAYGCRWVKTPAFDRVAREGLLFQRAYTPNAKCAPSRACILTGRNPWQLKETANHVCYFPLEFKTYAEALAERGYFCGKTGKAWGPGVALDAQQRARPLTGRGFDKRTAPPPAKAISNNDYAANFADFLDAVPAGQPWCFWYGSMEPHRAYEAGVGTAKGGKRLEDIDRVPGFWPDTPAVRQDLLDYAFEVEHFDRHLERMLEILDQRGLASNTLVVVTSDNGMPFPRAKGNLYELAAHMPLAIRWPQGIRNPGRVIEDYVSFVDFAPTFLEVAGITPAASGMAPMAGRSLVPLFRATRGGWVERRQRGFLLVGQERHDVGRPGDAGYPIRGVLRDDWLYLWNAEPGRWPACNPETGYLNCDGSPTKTLILEQRRRGAGDDWWRLCFGKRSGEELYDLGTDPDCLNNLAGHGSARKTVAALKQLMAKQLKAQGDPRLEGRGHVFDEYPYAEERFRNFYERFRQGEKLSPGWVEATDFEKGPVE
ncbi:sulfatase [Fontisphaera persica]|uniref:sulfatase family protein n=1 Tax=Fontisphaera persica TaxID=2974023 RepID=UPI0024BFDA3E|nr:sulfatase [Fontisphaera persica]WCJ59363.1 sulfatase [Fontisphaera persica]